jgi:FSR family fosmidomycin resistance protein-like MFS transporter
VERGGHELWFERRALASGVIVGFAFGLGGLLVPLFGAVADRFGLTAAFQAVAFVPLLALAFTGVLVLLLRRR